ncbi:MAG: GtrA family protein [Snowella sp.]|nr:GtrA family protein [Snowella sp.]
MSNLPKNDNSESLPKIPIITFLHNLLNLRIFKFLGVGGFCAGLSLLIMYGFTSLLGINYLISTVISIVVTNFIGFALNKYYTFQTHKKLFWREMWKYYSVMLSSYILNVIIMYFLVDFINIWYIYANILLIVILTPYNYLLHRNWSFKKKVVNQSKTNLSDNDN